MKKLQKQEVLMKPKVFIFALKFRPQDPNWEGYAINQDGILISSQFLKDKQKVIELLQAENYDGYQEVLLSENNEDGKLIISNEKTENEFNQAWKLFLSSSQR